MPVSESQPMASEMATAIGTRVRLSSRIPAVELRNIHAKVITAMSRKRRLEKRFTIAAIRYFSTPIRSRIKNVPPTRIKIAMIARPVTALPLVNASTGESAIFQIGMR